METLPTNASNADFWKRKLAAFLHDSPSKPLDIGSHELRADAALRRAGLLDDQGLAAYWNKKSDHTAAAADRLPFPSWQSSGVSCAYDPALNPFRHPLGASDPLTRTDTQLTSAQAEDVEQNNQPSHLETDYAAGSTEDARARFFAHWRLWRAHAISSHAGFATLPADTRIPDHTIWSHMGVVSALEGCNGRPALLKFQLGPVQDFIAAARSTRDLWSGSYLLSWLMAAGLARLAEEIGPDAVIFPNLWGQPLIDLHLKEKIWSKLRASKTNRTATAWEQFAYPTQPKHDTPLPLHTPNLPNVFLALVPADHAESLARLVEKSIRDEWDNIAASVRTYAAPLFILRNDTVPSDAAKRFEDTVARHLDLTWQTLPFDQNEPLNDLIERAARFLPHDEPEKTPTRNDAVRRVKALQRYFTAHMPEDHRDNRYYVGGKTGPKNQLNNLGIAWSLAVALNGWQLDATRSLRRFTGLPASSGQGNAAPAHGGKDALNGRDPMLFGGNSTWLTAVQKLAAPRHGDWKKLFRHTDEIGALTLIKRLWHLSYLRSEWGLQPHPMPNTYELASGRADGDDDDDLAGHSTEENNYYAILAFDGDSMGQWVSGAKTPKFDTQLARHSHRAAKLSPHAYFQQLDSKSIGPDAPRLLDLQRPLSPAYHLQFSETLSNFALHCAPRIVTRYGGKLLYAGGDDVLALVPAAFALACADDLQRVFRGLSPSIDCGITELVPGFLTLSDTKDHAGRPIPLILPGPRTTASVGIAIAHFKQPLQDVVTEARRAEKRAKKLAPGKHAAGLTLLKHSGETIQWDTRFDADDQTTATDLAHRGGLAAAQWLLCALGCDIGSTPDRQRPPCDEVVSSKFPYRLSALLEPHLSEHGLQDTLDATQLTALVTHELDHAIDRQRGDDWSKPASEETRNRLRHTLLTYLGNLPGTATQKLRALLGLLATAAFLGHQPALNAK